MGLGNIVTLVKHPLEVVAGVFTEHKVLVVVHQVALLLFAEEQ